jgi:hypothetical protein
MYQYFEFVVGAVLLTGLIDRNYKTQGQTDNQNFKPAVFCISVIRLRCPPSTSRSLLILFVMQMILRYCTLPRPRAKGGMGGHQ